MSDLFKEQKDLDATHRIKDLKDTLYSAEKGGMNSVESACCWGGAFYGLQVSIRLCDVQEYIDYLEGE